MANASGEISSDKLIDLRVVDLRSKLEKRGLDKTGVKAVLLERLEKALKNEGESLGNTEEKSDTVPSQELDALAKIEALCEEKLLEESQPLDVLQNELITDMDEKEAEISNVALADVFLNITNPDIDSLLPVKTSVVDLTENQLLSSDTKPSDMLVNDTFDKDQFVEELPVTTLDTNKETILQEESDVPLKDTTAPPEQSSSSAETNTKEENSEISSSAENTTKEKNSEISSSPKNTTKEEKSEKSSVAENTVEEEKSEQSSSASIKTATPSLNSNERKDEVAKTVLSDSLPPKPARVPRKAPFALKTTISMDTSTTQQSEENESLIVHVDDTQNDLDADLVASKTNKAKMDKTSKEKVSGKTEVKKTDGSTVEERSKGKTEGGQTEKKADEKKDDKDVKSKSSPVSKPKVVKNIKSNNQNSRNLWVSGLAASTCATDLKRIFTKYGKVVSAKVVKTARSPGARCYGFVTMSTVHEASKCIQYLNHTELQVRMISIKKAKNEPGGQILKMAETKPADKKVEKAEVKKDEKTDGDKKEGVKKVDKKEPMKDEKNRRMSGRRDDNKRQTSSSSHLKTSDKPRIATLNKNTAKPVTSVKRCAKPSSSANTKDKVSNAQKPKPGGPTATSETVKYKSGKFTKKDLLSFHQIKEKQRQLLRQQQRRLRKQERRRLKRVGMARVFHRDVEQKQNEEALRLESVRERLRFERIKLEKEKLLRYEMEKELLEMERIKVEVRCAEMLRMEEMRCTIKRPHDRSNLREEDLWDEFKRSRISNSSNVSRFELPFQNESRYNEYEDTDYERRVERYERRESRPLESGSRFDERKEREMVRREMFPVRDIRVGDERLTDDREMMRREMGPVRDIRVGDERRTDDREMMRREMGPVRDIRVGDERRTDDREMMRREMGPVRDIRVGDERRTDDRSRPEEKLSRMPYEFRRDMGLSREPERRYIDHDQGRDTDRQNISAHDRLVRVRSSLVGEPDQRHPWGSGSIDRKVDSWSHMHREMDNSGMNRSNDQWPGNPMNRTGRDATGAFVDNPRLGNIPRSGGMMQNMRPTNMFGNSQSQRGIMMVTHGGGGMSGRMQGPHFDAYKIMGSM